jgi:hypothetical protein
MSDFWTDGPSIEDVIDARMHGAPDCYRVQTLARMGVIGRSKLFELIRTGQLKAKKLDSCTIVLRSEWIRYLQSLPDLNVHARETARRAAARVRRARVEQRAAARERPADQQAHARRPARQRT